MTTGERVSSHDSAAVAVQTSARAASLTAGQMLRQAREHAGMHLATLAAVLKVPTQRLEALEADKYDQLPGMAFVRGLAASMARTLKLDVSQVLDLLPRGESTLKQDHAVASVSKHRALPSHSAGKSRWTRVLAVVIVLLLVGAAAILFLPQIRGTSSSDDAESQALAAADAGASSVDGASSAVAANVSPGAAPEPALSSLTPMVPSPNVSPSAAASAGTQPATAVAALPSATTASAASGPAATTMPNLTPQGAMAIPTTGTVVFSAKGESWVEVIDGNKLPLLRRTLQSGERVGVSGAEPLSVTVGSTQNVQVEVRGQAFDLASHRRGNVARFQVK